MKINQQQTPVQVSEWNKVQPALPRYSLKARIQMLTALVLALPKRVLSFLKTRKTSRYLYSKGVHKHPASWVGVIVVVFLAGFWLVNIYQPTLADTDTQTIRPNGVIGGAENNFANTNGTGNSSCTGHCDYVDEADDGTYLSTGSSMSATAEEEFDMGDISVPGGGTLDQITQVQVTVRADINTQGSDADGLQVRLYIDGAYHGTTNSVTLTSTTTDHTFTWSSLTASTASDIRVEVVRVVNGSGNPNNQDDDIWVYEVKADVTFDFTPPAEPPPYLTMEGYTFTGDNEAENNMNSSASAYTTGGSGNAWTGATNIYESNDTYATLTNPAYQAATQYLEITDFNFNIPDGAILKGFEVHGEMYGNYFSGISYNSWLIESAGISSGKGFNFSSSEEVETLGGSSGSASNLWFGDWSVAHINSSNFGVRLSAFNDSEALPNGSWNIDHISVTVYYSFPESIAAGSEFTTGKTLSQVRKGERIGLRTHITNDGGELTSDTEFGLFYDRNDGIWTKVQQPQTAHTGAGSGCADSNWSCGVLDSGGANTVGSENSLAIDPATGWATVAYDDESSDTLEFARYVGSGGTNCDGTTATGSWSCETVDLSSGNDTGDYPYLSYNQNGTPWISYIYTTGSDLRVARYVGSGGDCDSLYGGSDSWSCESVDTSSTVEFYTSMTFDGNGNPWVAYYDSSAGALKLAKYVGGGSGSGCADSDWDGCSVIYDDGDPSDLGMVTDGNGDIWIAFLSVFGGIDLSVAKYVGTGGSGCAVGVTDWDCYTIHADGNVGYYTVRMATAPDGTPWISYHDDNSENLHVAYLVGSGGNCDTQYSGATEADAWQCDLVESTNSVGRNSSIAFTPSGEPWVTYYDHTAGNLNLRYARYVGGSNGSGCADSNWTCANLDTTGDIGQSTSLAFNYQGAPWVSYYDNTNGNLRIATIERAGEITLSPSTNLSIGKTLTESSADMTSSSDTTNRDDADCLSVGSSWNDGLYSSADSLSGLTLPNGETTAQCTELGWTIDTSNAVPGTTYRFVVATNDSFNPDKNPWRGPVDVVTAGYPTLTVASEEQSTYRYSKDVLGAVEGNCTNTAWQCEVVDTFAHTTSSINMTNIEIDPSGNPWIAYHDSSHPVDGQSLRVARYVGSGGTGCDDSDKWSCTTVHANANTGRYPNMIFDKSGVAHVVFHRNTDNSLRYAKYVGSGGSGCADAAWDDCGTIISSSANPQWLNLAVDSANNLSIAYKDYTAGEVRFIEHVGSGGTGCSTDVWHCSSIDDVAADTNTSSGLSYALGADGIKIIAYMDVTNNQIKMASWIGSGGTGCANTTEWSCIVLDSSGLSGSGEFNTLVIGNDGGIHIAYHQAGGGGLLRYATFVGDGTGSGCDSSDWTCYSITNSIGYSLRHITTDKDGVPWIAYTNTSSQLEIARLVGSGGTGCSATSVWSCFSVDSSAGNKAHPNITFDNSNVAWIVYGDDTNDNLLVARMDAPFGTSKLRYSLSAGLAPYTDPYGTCASPTGTNNGYCGAYHPDGQSDSVTAKAYERPIFNFSTRFGSNSTLPTATLHFKTDVSPSTNNVVLQVYRYGSTNAWETVSTYSSAGCSSENCIIRAIPSGSASEYFETDGSNYWVHYRAYQVESSSSSITFEVDSFTAEVPQKQMRGGRVFRELQTDPLGW